MRFSSFRADRRDLATGLCVAVVLGLGVGATLPGDSPLRPLAGLGVALAVAPAVVLAFRRRAPLAVTWAVVALAAILPLVEWLSPGTLVRTGTELKTLPILPAAAPFAAYTAMAYGGNRRSALAAVAVLLLLAGVSAEVVPDTHDYGARHERSPGALQFRSLVLIGMAALLGLYVAARIRVVEALTERAERAERERHLLAEQVRAEERARLAAEMHDVVAHRVTLMVLQAGALRVRAQDEPTRAAAEEVRRTGATALEELRDVIGLLRRGEVDQAREVHEPLPDLSALVAESVAVGVRVELVETGDRPLASPVVGRTAYRVVQESLTNVHKHAPGASVTVHVRYSPRRVRIVVRNSAPDAGADTPLAAAGSGTGLRGLRQRVELIGGRLRAAPGRDGGFYVAVVLPAFVATSGPEPEPVP
ncbi:sensor histidine kinase [Actinomadura fibrosa]|uniref:histidine kinase n=1 Tax=Actinomadura fibrosa TaxID=111802 RepID=A0ABW2XJM4_9ACTN|nr:histidine kinase [Actinomadura fibrosa]